VAQAVMRLPCKCEALSSNPSAEKKKTKKEKKRKVYVAPGAHSLYQIKSALCVN
jgi:hypothetical protein